MCYCVKFKVVGMLINSREEVEGKEIIGSEILRERHYKEDHARVFDGLK